jgi:protein-S-isoprenylcysteine O-methyltransferase Ste14
MLLWAVIATGLIRPAWGGIALVVSAVAGVVLIALGGLLALRGARDLRDAFTPLPHPRDDARLVETGIYARARHPIYGGVILGAFGWGLLVASAVALAMAAVLVGFFALKSAREEAWLMVAFPGYAAYRRRTRRFIPWIG